MTDLDWGILARFGVSPENLSVSGSLYLERTQITALPESLSVSGSLNLRETQITALPESLFAGERLFLEGTQITALFEDDRGYRLDRAGNRYIAGCRNFSADEAIAHWGSPDYRDPLRGAAFVAAVKAEEKRRKRNA